MVTRHLRKSPKRNNFFKVSFMSLFVYLYFRLSNFSVLNHGMQYVAGEEVRDLLALHWFGEILLQFAIAVTNYLR